MVRAWVYKKDEVLSYGDELGVSLAGTLDAMRRQFGEWVERNEVSIPYSLRIAELSRLHGRRASLRDDATTAAIDDDLETELAHVARLCVPSTSSAARLQDTRQGELKATSTPQPEIRPRGLGSTTQEYPKVAKQVREWSFLFDGTTKPLEFLEQEDCSANTYGLDLDPAGMSLKWYVANNRHWTAWATFVRSFQEFFLPRGY
ncbi:hypothetical protein AWZ03_015412, partial [Drosophila navojoa]